MRLVQRMALSILVVVYLAALLADFIAPAHYSRQFRDTPEASPSVQFLLGTDDLGRDRFSRLLYGSRVSLVLAPAAALLSTLIAGLVGGVAGFVGRWPERLAMRGSDLFLSLPWLFLLLTVRALLPLNTEPEVSVAITFALLGLLGWVTSARVVIAGAGALRASDLVLQARATGCYGLRLITRHVLPNLKPVLLAQFWIAIPVFILSEANLGVLGLGVAEPLPSWGGLLRELEHLTGVFAQPWRLAPVGLLVLVVSCFHIVFSQDEVAA